MWDVKNLKRFEEQLLLEIAKLLQTNTEQNDKSALVSNQEMQRRLEQLRKCMREALKMVRARYKRNEDTLISRQRPRSQKALSAGESVGKSGAVLRGGSFRFKGILYFRDVNGRSCPNNEDYESRFSTEMFPTDFDMRSKHVWTVLDKKNLVTGVKQQLLDHIMYQKDPKTKVQSASQRKQKDIELHVQTLRSLLSAADSSFSLDWNQISTLDMEYRHTSYSCEAMWLVYLNPELKRDDWSAQEDKTLLAAAKANNLQNWQAIAAAVHQRSDYQCFVRVQTGLRMYLDTSNNFKWNSVENERLIKIVQKNTVDGETNWSQVVQHFPGKSRSTLIGRYMYVLHPSISHEPFTRKEDLMLFAAFEDYKGKFNIFPRDLFPNRSLAQLRTRYNNVLAQRNKTDSWSVADDQKLTDYVTAHGSSSWVNCANHLGNHTRTSCRTRFLVITRFLAQNPNAKVADIPRRKTAKKSHVTVENWPKLLQEWEEDPDTMFTDTKPVREAYVPKSKRFKSDNSVDLYIYESFKYAYSLNLSVPPQPKPLPTHERNLYVNANALRFRPRTTAVWPIDSFCLSKNLNRCYNKMLRQLSPYDDGESAMSTPLLLSPNWSTMMCFRAMCIKSVHGYEPNEVAKQTKPPILCDESNTKLQSLRQRMRTLLYRTTLLSRLEPSMFDHLPAAMLQFPHPIVTQTKSLADKQQQETHQEQQQKKLQQQRKQQQQKKQQLEMKQQLKMKQLANHQLEKQQRKAVRITDRTPGEVVHQIEDLNCLRNQVKSEPADSEDEPNVKQELLFE